MQWREYHEAGIPLSFAYPAHWTLQTHEALELHSPDGSVIHWSAYRAPDDRGDEVTVEPLPNSEGGERWQLSRRHVVVRMAYVADPEAATTERDVIEAILGSTRPDPELPEAAQAFVDEVRDRIRASHPEAAIEADGMALQVEGHGVVDLSRTYRDVRVHPHGRELRIQQLLDLLSVRGHAEAALADWAAAQARVFPLLVAPESDSVRLLRAFHDPLKIGYALDFGPSMRRVEVDYLETWGVTEEAVHEAALANLATTHPLRLRIPPEGKRGVILCGGFTFATGEVLLPRFREALVPRLGERFLVGLPARDVVAAARLQDRLSLRGFVGQALSADAFPLTKQRFVCDASGFTADVG